MWYKLKVPRLNVILDWYYHAVQE